jgi:hypothetical protein
VLIASLVSIDRLAALDMRTLTIMQWLGHRLVTTQRLAIKLTENIPTIVLVAMH